MWLFHKSGGYLCLQKVFIKRNLLVRQCGISRELMLCVGFVIIHIFLIQFIASPQESYILDVEKAAILIWLNIKKYAFDSLVIFFIYLPRKSNQSEILAIALIFSVWYFKS